MGALTGGEVLAYAPVERGRERGWWRWLFVGLAGVAGVTPWVGFAHEVSPWDVVWAMLRGENFMDLWGFLMLAAPFFVGVVRVLWTLRLAIGGRARFGERAGAWVMGVGSLCMTGYMVIFLMLPDTSSGDWQMWCAAASLGMMVSGGALAWWLWWRGRAAEVVATVPLYTAYLANAVVCMVAFVDQRSVGWWLTGVACGGLVAELVVCGIGVGSGSREGARG